jgi:hypothetical protein
LLGYAEGDIGATPESSVQLIHPDDLAETQNQIQAPVSTAARQFTRASFAFAARMAPTAGCSPAAR